MYYPYEETVDEESGSSMERLHDTEFPTYEKARQYVDENPKYQGVDYYKSRDGWLYDVKKEITEEDVLEAKMISLGVNPRILSVDQVNDGSSLTSQERQEIIDDVATVLERQPTAVQEEFYDELRYMFSQLTKKGEKINIPRATSGVKVTETDFSRSDIGGKRITETMPNLFRVNAGDDAKIRFLPHYTKFEDHHISPSAMNWKPDNTFQSVGRIRRKKFVPKLIRIGRYYTQDKLDATAPRSLKFSTRRAAKRFFSKPLIVRSQKQMVAVFGKPSTSAPAYGHFDDSGVTEKLWVRRTTDVADKHVMIDVHSGMNSDKPLIIKFLKERPPSDSYDKFWIRKDFSDMKFTDEEKPND